MPLDSKMYQRVSLAIYKVKRLYPGPVAEMLAIELMAWRDYGYWIGAHSSFTRLIEHIENTPLESPKTNTNEGEAQSA